MKITAIIPTRNDNFGGSLLNTATYCLQTMSKTFEEVILVDLGSPDPIASALEQSVTEKKGNIRIITVPREWLMCKVSDDTTFPDVFARNIAIRRASNDIILSTNIDCMPAKLEKFDFNQYNPDVFYSSGKFMIEHLMITDLRAQGKSWDFIQDYLFDTKDSYFRQGGYYGDPWSIVNGCGDFQLGHRKIWFAPEVKGFEESLIYKGSLDTNLHKKVIVNYGGKVESAPFFYIFHQSHQGNWGTQQHNNVHTAVHGFGVTTNSDDWGAPNEIFKETII